jgi:hypothetical protein
MSKKKKRNLHAVRKKLVGVPDSAWVGTPGETFEAGLRRIFNTPPQELGPIANSSDLEMSVSAMNSRIELGITEFAKIEKAKTREALKQRRLEAEVRSQELDNALKEVALLQALKNARLTAHFRNGRLKFQPYNTPPTAPQIGSQTKELTSGSEDSRER